MVNSTNNVSQQHSIYLFISVIKDGEQYIAIIKFGVTYEKSFCLQRGFSVLVQHVKTIKIVCFCARQKGLSFLRIVFDRK